MLTLFPSPQACTHARTYAPNDKIRNILQCGCALFIDNSSRQVSAGWNFRNLQSRRNCEGGLTLQKHIVFHIICGQKITQVEEWILFILLSTVARICLVPEIKSAVFMLSPVTLFK